MAKFPSSHVEIAHRTRGRVRLRVHRDHRTVAKMELLRRAFAELHTIVHSVRIAPLTGSIVIHHYESEDVFIHLSVVLAQFGLTLALDEPLASDQGTPSMISSLVLLVGAPVVNWAIDYLGLGILHRIFLLARLWLHLHRVWHQGAVQLPALILFLIDAFFTLGTQPA